MPRYTYRNVLKERHKYSFCDEREREKNKINHKLYIFYQSKRVDWNRNELRSFECLSITPSKIYNVNLLVETSLKINFFFSIRRRDMMAKTLDPINVKPSWSRKSCKTKKKENNNNFFYKIASVSFHMYSFRLYSNDC